MGIQKDLEEIRKNNAQIKADWNQRTPKEKKWIVGILLVICLIVWRGCFYESKEDSNIRLSKDAKIAAVFMAQEFVKQRLKAPSTADFQNAYNAEVVKESGTTYFISSYVDAENSFGAKLRMNYKCRVEFTNDGMAKCTYFSMDE